MNCQLPVTTLKLGVATAKLCLCVFFYFIALPIMVLSALHVHAVLVTFWFLYFGSAKFVRILEQVKILDYMVLGFSLICSRILLNVCLGFHQAMKERRLNILFFLNEVGSHLNSNFY